MTNEMKTNFLNHRPLTCEALNTLQQKGFKYLQVQGYTLDHHLEYVDPHYLMLIPFKELSAARSKMDVYEAIDSDIIREWVKTADTSDRVEIFLAGAN